MADTHLEIVIDETGKAKVTCSGDMASLAKAVILLARCEEEFLMVLNIGLIMLQDDIKAAQVRDEMIGFIIPNK